MRRFRDALSAMLLSAAAIGAYVTFPGTSVLAAGPRPATPAPGTLDQQLTAALTTLIDSAEVEADGKLFLADGPRDQRFLARNSGRYYQINGQGTDAFASRSLWERRLELSGRKAWTEPLLYDSAQFPDEPLRIVERTVRLPGSDIEWQFAVAAAHGS